MKKIRKLIKNYNKNIYKKYYNIMKNQEKFLGTTHQNMKTS